MKPFCYVCNPNILVGKKVCVYFTGRCCDDLRIDPVTGQSVLAERTILHSDPCSGSQNHAREMVYISVQRKGLWYICDPPPGVGSGRYGSANKI